MVHNKNSELGGDLSESVASITDESFESLEVDNKDIFDDS